MTVFTDLSIRKFKPKEKRYQVKESGRQGFGIRISPTGVKTFFMEYRKDGKLTRLTLGTYPNISLSEAREILAKHRQQVEAGEDPGIQIKAIRQFNLEAPTVAELADLYIERHAKRHKRTWANDRRILDHDVLPFIGKKKAADVKRREIIALLDNIVDRGADTLANRTLAVTRKMFNFALERDILEASPCVMVKMPGKERPRERNLSFQEIKLFWDHVDDLVGQPIATALKLQLALGQRKEDISAAPWSEFDLESRWWEIPATRYKTNRDHRVPLSDLAIELLELPREGDYVISWHGKPVILNNVNQAIYRVRKDFERLGIAPFTPRDLRRTAASRMAEIGIPRTTISKILGHAEGGITGRHYDKYQYAPEKVSAMQAWGRKLEEVVSGKVTDNVVPIQR